MSATTCPFGGQQRRTAAAADRRARHVGGDDAVQETAAVGAGRDDELAPAVDPDGALRELADVGRAVHLPLRFFIARSSRNRTARRRRRVREPAPIVRRLQPQRQHGPGAPPVVDRDERQVSARRLPPRGERTVLGEHAHADLHRRRAAKFTCASIVTTSPRCTGVRKCRRSIDAVTTGPFACRAAEMPAAMSIHCVRMPPNTVPWTLVNPGNTTCSVLEREARGV